SVVREASLAGGALAAWATAAGPGGKNFLDRLALVWLGAILTQVLLGAATIWSNKAADIATAHVLVGALSLALGAILSIVSRRELMFAYRETDLSTASEARALFAPQMLPAGVTPLPQR